MHRSDPIILRESVGPHMKDDKIGENNMIKKCVRCWYDTWYKMMTSVYNDMIIWWCYVIKNVCEMIIWYMIYDIWNDDMIYKENMLIWKMKKIWWYDIWRNKYDEKKRKHDDMIYEMMIKRKKERKYDDTIHEMMIWYMMKKRKRQEKIWSYMKWWYDIW